MTYQATYEAYGKRTQESGSTFDRQKANTKDEDPTGLLNEGFRYRDLDTGTFITRDPLGFVDGPNMYAYVVDNPWTKFDPEGLELRDVAPALGQFGVGVAKGGYGAIRGFIEGGGKTVGNAIVHPVDSLVTPASNIAHNWDKVPAATSALVKEGWNNLNQKLSTNEGKGEVLGALAVGALAPRVMGDTAPTKNPEPALVEAPKAPSVPETPAPAATSSPSTSAQSTFTSTQEFNGIKVYQRGDIDWKATDARGRTNIERSQQGLAPLGKDGQPINLHHVGQEPGVVAEATQATHQKGYSTLHKSLKESKIDRSDFNKWKKDYWKSRAADAQKKNN